MNAVNPAITLATPLSLLKRISASYQAKLKHLGLKTVEDLLRYLPRRYDDFSQIKQIKDLFAGETATVQGIIENIKLAKTWKRRMYIVEAQITDDSGSIKAVWFNQPYLATTLKKGLQLNVSGKVVAEGKKIFFQNPAYEIIRNSNQFLTHTARLVPVYPETKGLTSRWLRYVVKQFLPLTKQLREFLPFPIIEKYKFPLLTEAIQEIHFPGSKERLGQARARLGFEEVFLIQLFLLKQRANLKKETAPAIAFDQKLIRPFVESLPFRLTQSQRQAAWDIFKDIQKSEPMNRLLNGDVGSGKTLVASLASLQTAKAHAQAVFLVPTEVLAWQHFNTLAEMFQKAGVDVTLYTRSQLKHFHAGLGVSNLKSKSEMARLISSGRAQIIVGTHALLQENLIFPKLGLVIIDEQHRFGVAQRAKLLNQKLLMPHLLSMTATPIPRTLSLAIYGDLDISLLLEMPKGQRAIATQIITPESAGQMYRFIRERVKQGEQAFVICPRIEETQTNADYTQIYAKIDQRESASGQRRSALGEMKAVESEYKKLQKIFPEFRLAKLHGKMRPQEKEKILEQMRQREIDVLVSTSVIEVGIDIPNAAILVVEDAHRFGLSQLHQFRGRIGRSGQQAWCFLTTDNEDSQRLQAMVETNDGFKLAEKDLEIRGPGEFFGTTQWGFPELTLGSLTDLPTVQAARNEAGELLARDPDLEKYPALKQKFSDFKKSVHLE